MSLCEIDIEYKLFLHYLKKLYLLPCVAHTRHFFFKLGTWGKKDMQVLNIVRTYVLCLFMPYRTEWKLKYSKLVQSDAVGTFQVQLHLIQESRKLSLALQVLVLRKLVSIGLPIVLSIFFTERLICKFFLRFFTDFAAKFSVRIWRKLGVFV